VEVDCIGARHFDPEAVAMVEQAFGNVSSWDLPSHNPGYVNGVELHIGVDEQGLADPGFTSSVLNAFRTIKTAHFGTPVERDSGFTDAKRLVYRYCIFAADVEGCPSGMAEIVGNDFLTALAEFDSAGISLVRDQAGTFMHELGHTLGL